MSAEEVVAVLAEKVAREDTTDRLGDYVLFSEIAELSEPCLAGTKDTATIWPVNVQARLWLSLSNDRDSAPGNLFLGERCSQGPIGRGVVVIEILQPDAHRESPR